MPAPPLDPTQTHLLRSSTDPLIRWLSVHRDEFFDLHARYGWRGAWNRLQFPDLYQRRNPCVPLLPEQWFCSSDDYVTFAPLAERLDPARVQRLLHAAQRARLRLLRTQDYVGGYCLGLRLVCRLHGFELRHPTSAFQGGFPRVVLRRATRWYPLDCQTGFGNRFQLATTLGLLSSRPERKFGAQLFARWRFKSEYHVPGSQFKIDFAWPESAQPLFVEFDEPYHASRAQQRKDRERALRLADLVPGMRLLRVKPERTKRALSQIAEHLGTEFRA